MAVLPESTELVWRELSGEIDPLAVLEALRAQPCAWLLDSALRGSRLGRHSFVGAAPWAVLQLRDGEVQVEVLRRVDGVPPVGRHALPSEWFETLRAWRPTLPRDAAAPPLPFVGGAVALLGYEMGELCEPVRLHGDDDLGLADATLLLVDRLIGWDHLAERVFACGLGLAARRADARAAAEANLDAALGWCEREASPPRRLRPPAHPGRAATPVAAGFDEPGYAKAVATVKEQIEAGNVYQANLTQRVEGRFDGDPWEVYRALRRVNPAPFACYVELEDVTVAGSSPERFLRIGSDRMAESRPIKGTRPRGASPEEDAALRRALARSEKDRAENLMIVDLVRNDLGRACETGSVAVPELMTVEEYASVFQLVSTVTGTLRDDRDALDLVRATFPPGSMTGAPKIAAMQLLDRLEPVRRGLYSGAIGYLDVRGGVDLCVVIRTLFFQAERVLLHAGGGVVADSDPHEEWRESWVKARALLTALAEAARSRGR